MSEYPLPGNGTVGSVTPAIMDALEKTRPWVQFLGILGFCLTGLMLVAGLGMSVFGVYFATTRGAEGVMFVGMGVLYLLLGILYVFPSRFLWKYGRAISAASSDRANVAHVERALYLQKSFWKFAGIMTLIMILLYIPLIIVAIALPNFLSAMSR